MQHFKLGRKALVAVVLTLLLVPSAAQAQTQTPGVDILKIYNEVINQHNPDEWIKYFTDDAVINFPGQPPVQGKAAVLAFAKQTGLFAIDPNLQVIIAPHVVGNKVLEESSTVSAQFPSAGRIVFDSVTEFQGDKIKSFTLIPTPETIKKLSAATGQSTAPGLPSTGAGGSATAATVHEDTNWLNLALIGSGTLVFIVVGFALILSRRSFRR